MTTQEPYCHIRWVISRDMPEVMAIESSAFEFPWTEDEFVRLLLQRNFIGLACEYDSQVVGYVFYGLHKTRLRVLNLAVHSDFRGQSVGRTLIYKLIGKLSHQRRNRLLLEVRESNLSALNFFKAMGFRATGILRDFYDDTTEDAYAMEYRVSPPDDPQRAGMPVNRIRHLTG